MHTWHGKDEIIQCQKNKLIKVIPNYGPSFIITFGIMAKGFRNKRANILQLTTGRKCCKSDTRIPGLFVSKHGTVQVVMEINGSIMKQSIVRLARKSWYHFVIQQKLNEDNKVIHISFQNHCKL